MRDFLARRPSPAMAVAFVALLAALSGTAIALPGTNSVDSGDIKNNQVRSKDIRNNNVRGRDVRTSTLNGTDVLDESLTGADINESTLGTVPSATTATSAPPSGPAGGDLTGTYPDPLIGDDKVTAAKIAPDAVGKSEISSAAVGADELGGTQLATSNGPIAASNNASTSVACPAGTQVLSGGGTSSSFGIVMVSSFQSGNGWIVAYHNNNAAAGTITAIATCLSG
ncbi:MAG TPA: hypothetical protein VFY47_10805 [Thermoleophilaceae bacterium]|nr:hypothetical protein [Thermoleophilaceae bacterium]